MDEQVKNLASKYGFSSGLTTVIRDIFNVKMDAGPIRHQHLEEDSSKVGVTYSSLNGISISKIATLHERLEKRSRNRCKFDVPREMQIQSIPKKFKCGKEIQSEVTINAIIAAQRDIYLLCAKKVRNIKIL